MSVLKLVYSFNPDPSPIRASAPGANSSVIDLQVLISTEKDAVTVNRITIVVPVGGNNAQTLSAMRDLPKPVSESEAWDIRSTGSVVTVKPAAGNPGKITTQPVVFTLPGIIVNEVPSAAVPITITEWYDPTTHQTDATTYSLTKLESELLVDQFHADPNTLNDFDLKTHLYWQCTEKGKDCTFRIRADDLTRWQPKDCLTDGICYTCQDGIDGVQTRALVPSQGTSVVNFKLDVIVTASPGHRSVYQTLQTSVQVGLPSVSGNSRLEQGYSRFARLRWIAYNAGRCRVTLEDGTTLIDNGAVDTYQDGQLVVLTGRSGQRQVTIKALAQSGSASYSYSYPLVSVRDPAVITFADVPTALAINPAGTLALVGLRNGTLRFVALPSGAVDATTIAVKSPSGIAITPDGKLAFVSTDWDTTVTVVDLVNRRAESTITVWNRSFDVACTPDGALVLVSDGNANYVSVINVATRQKEPNPIPIYGGIPSKIVVTPDGKFALVLKNRGGTTDTVAVIDIAARRVTAEVGVGVYAAGIDISRDGSFALVANVNSQNLTVIDLPAFTVRATIPLGTEAAGVAISPDGKVALVATLTGPVTVIELPSLRVVGSIPASCSFYGMEITADGTLAVVASQGNAVTLI